VAQPDQKAQDNSWEVKIPYMLSILSTHSAEGQVIGLKDFTPGDQPPVTLPFYAFRIMVLLGFVMLFLVLWALWQWYRKRLRVESASKYRIFWNFWLYAIPAGFLATECGWIVREVGRQPWLVYGILRTTEGVSPVGITATATSLSLFIVVYLFLLGLFIHFATRILKKGPDMTSPLPTLRQPNSTGGS
jgi:cytochrome d ubiquinol oxidase subunit I